MKPVAALAVTAFVVATAATLFVQESRERVARLEREEARHQQLTQHFEKLEQLLTNAAFPDQLAQLAELRALAAPVTGQATATADSKVSSAKETAERAAAHAAVIQSAAAIVDGGIQSGQWSVADEAAFNAAAYTLSGEEQVKIMARLAAAINRDEVRVERHTRVAP